MTILRSANPSIIEFFDEYGVPSARFDAGGGLIGVSPSAAELLSDSVEVLLEQSARLARRLVDERARPGGDRPRALLVPGADIRVVLRAQAFRRDDGTLGVLVLFLPSRAARERLPLQAWGLSTREFQVAREIATGASTKAIASRLGISVHTARRHTERVFSKLGAQTRTQVALMLRGGTTELSAS